MIPDFPFQVRRLCRIGALLCVALMPLDALGQVWPEATCVEYSNNFNPPEAFPYFSYYNSSAQSVGVSRGFPNNYLFPALFDQQPNSFLPGYQAGFTFPIAVSNVYIQWYLLDGASQSTFLTYNSANDGQGLYGSVSQPSPTCTPQFVPVTTLSLAGAGTYTHQYLGQIRAGPPAGGATLAVSTFSPASAITLTNVSYVPDDGSNPGHVNNPNSIYGDVTISGSATGSTSIFVQLTANGAVIADGIVPIAY